MSYFSERAAEREIDLLQDQLADADPEERRAILREIRDIEREEAERERWEQEGEGRGWR
jgi:hypothetical protein